MGQDQLPKIPIFMLDQSSATADTILPVRFPSAGKCTSHLGVSLGCFIGGLRYGFDAVPRQYVALLKPPLLFHEHNLFVFLQVFYLGSHNEVDYFPVLAQYCEEHFGQHILPDKLMDENVAAFRIKPAFVLGFPHEQVVWCFQNNVNFRAAEVTLQRFGTRCLGAIPARYEDVVGHTVVPILQVV